MIEISFFKCPFCGSEATIKDNEKFSSLLCSCRILLFYYENCVNLEIKKEEYLDYKKRKLRGAYYGEEKGL